MKNKSTTQPTEDKSKFALFLESANLSLTDEAKGLIIEAFDSAVDDKTKTRVDAALASQDARIAEQTEILLENIDGKYTKQAERMLTTREKQYTKLLKATNDRYKGEMVAEARQFKNNTIKKLSKFIDLKIDEAIPLGMITEAVNNTRASQIVQEFTERLAVDNAMSNKVIRDGISDGNKQIQTLNESLKVKSTELENALEIVNEHKKEQFINNKLKGMDQRKSKHIKTVFDKSRDQSFEYLTETFDYIDKLYESDNKQTRESIVDKHKRSRGQEQSSSTKEFITETISNREPARRREEETIGGSFIDAMNENY